MLLRLISILILAGLLVVGAVLASVAILVGGAVLAGFLLRLWWRSRSGAQPVSQGRPGPEIIEGEFTVEQGSPPPRESLAASGVGLTPEELNRARDIRVWLVWYEDRFHFGEDRDSFPVAVCLSEGEANAELARRGRPLPASGGDGYEVKGPWSLFDCRHFGLEPGETIRDVLRHIDSGGCGPVAIRI